MLQRSLRNRLMSAPRRSFGVFVICWLNLIVAPCAMALDVEQGCPHAPAVIEQGAGHHGHHATSTAAAHDCKTLQSDCCDSPAANLDTRGTKFKSTPDNPAIVYSELPGLQHAARPVQDIAAYRVDSVGTSPPLHKLYCVYLN